MKALVFLHRCWPVLFLFFVLLVAPLIAGHLFGRNWKTAVAAAALVVWLVMRPWRFACLASDERAPVLYSGTGLLALFALNSAIRYLSFERAI